MNMRPLSPHLQIYGPTRTMVLSILHRLTGIALSVSVIALVAWLVALADNTTAYAGVLVLLRSPIGVGVLCLLISAFAYHLCAGIRHLVFDSGRALERPEARQSALILIAAACVLAALGIFWMLKAHA